MGGDGWDSPELLSLGECFRRSIFVNHYSPDDQIKKFKIC